MAQSGRALGLGPRGCRFDSCLLDNIIRKERKNKMNWILLGLLIAIVLGIGYWLFFGGEEGLH